ncbi:MAG: PHP domain-containing protein [Lachnospiraceae bacterium]|nr:PHP domain-containing protein [Lachnospiraceae bacterium]
MKLVDLHVHSNASDGSLSPTEVVLASNEACLTAIALTDHDTVSGVAEALETADSLDLEVIPGVELSCFYKEKEIHILGLYVDHNSESLHQFLTSNAKKRRERNEKMVEAFRADGFDITMEDLLLGNPKTIITRAHFARALVNKGYVSTPDQAFKKYLDPDRPYYRKREVITPEESIKAIREAGGFPVLAHPCQYKLGWQGIEDLVVELRSYGLLGLECFHSSNNQHESGKLRAIALKHDLALTGGSDFHGAAKPDIQLGVGRGGLKVSAAYLDTIKLAMFFGQVLGSF